MIRNQQLTLIDFNIAAFALSKENNVDHLGNAGFSAPESFSQSNITLASDIYSIGKLLEYLTGYLEKHPSRPLRQIIQKATHPVPELRYETVEALAHALTLLSQQTNRTRTHLAHVTIAMIGSHHGCGVTHLGISLVSALNAYGISAVYQEKNTRNSLRNAAESMMQLREEKGYYHYRYFRGIPQYGSGVHFTPSDANVKIYDYGTAMEWEGACLADPDVTSSIDHIFFVITGAPWDFVPLLRQYDKLRQLQIPCTIISNFCDRRQSIRLASALRSKVYSCPFEPNPFAISQRKAKFCLSLLDNL